MKFSQNFFVLLANFRMSWDFTARGKRAKWNKSRLIGSSKVWTLSRLFSCIFLFGFFYLTKKNKICGLRFFFLISGMQHFCGRVRSGFWVILTSLFLVGKKNHSFFPRHDFAVWTVKKNNGNLQQPPIMKSVTISSG